MTPDFISERCYSASQSVIYNNAYNVRQEALRRCIEKAQTIGHEEWQLLEKALEHQNAINLMLERASCLQGFRDVINLMGGMQLD